MQRKSKENRRIEQLNINDIDKEQQNARICRNYELHILLNDIDKRTVERKNMMEIVNC